MEPVYGTEGVDGEASKLLQVWVGRAIADFVNAGATNYRVNKFFSREDRAERQRDGEALIHLAECNRRLVLRGISRAGAGGKNDDIKRHVSARRDYANAMVEFARYAVSIERLYVRLS